jgi:hypothetical protein
MRGVRVAMGTAVLVLSVPVLAPSAPAAAPKSSPQSLLVAAMADLRGGRGFHADAFGDSSRTAPDAPIIDVEYTDDLQGLMIVDALGHVGTAGSVPVFGDAVVTSGVVDAALTPSGQGYYMLTVDGHVAVDGDAEFRGNAVGSVPGTATESVAIAPFVNAPGYLILEKHAITGYPGSLPPAPTGTPEFIDIVDAPQGYIILDGAGGIYAYGGGSLFNGSLSGLKLNNSPVAMAEKSDGSGYWIVDQAGAIFAFGSALFYGYTNDLFPVTGISGVPNGYVIWDSYGDVAGFGSLGGANFLGYQYAGYWMVDDHGTVYGFGGAANWGSVSNSKSVVDIEPTFTSLGYWTVDTTGRVTAFGDARLSPCAAVPPSEKVTALSALSLSDYWLFTDRGRAIPCGSAPSYGGLPDLGIVPNGPVLDAIPTATGRGYYMVGSDGGIFAFGDAEFFGSMGDERLNAPVQSLVPDPDGKGYWLVASDGGIFAFGADFHGSMGDKVLNKPVTGMVPFGDGYLMVAEDGGIFDFSSFPFFGSLGDRTIPYPIVSVAVAQ